MAKRLPVRTDTTGSHDSTDTPTRGPAPATGHILLIAFALLFVVGFMAIPRSVQAQRVPPDFPTTRHVQKYVPGRLLVRFRPNISPSVKANAHAMVGSSVRVRFRRVAGLELVDLPAGKDVLAAVKEYRNNPAVLYAEPDFRVYPTSVTPNDPLFPKTWGLQNLGDQGGIAGADIGATLAWQLATGSRNVVIGQLDTGIYYTHPDLAPNIYQNTPECNSNGLDNDGNGYVNDCHGIDVAGDNPQNDPTDFIGHGTHTAGTMGAEGDNGLGVAGVNWQVSLLPCKFIDFDGGTTSGAIQCLDYMAWMKEHGANIVATNNSWGGGFYSQALYDAIEAQMEDGILFIASAGNGDVYDNSSDNDVNPVYPASYDLPNIISVAATDRRDDLAWFSNYGLRSVHLGAPGVSVVSTYGSGYGELSGTSMAAPHVTGSAALLQAFNPSLDWTAIKNLLMTGGDADPNLANTVTGNRLNVYGALTCSNRHVEAREEPRNDLITASPYTPILLRELNIACAIPAGPVTVTVQPSGQTIPLLDDGNFPDLAANDGVYSASWTPPAPGSYRLGFPNGDNVTVMVLVPYAVSSAPSTYVLINGTNLELNDETSKPVDVPFPIHFGGQKFSRVYVADNGLLTFDRAYDTPVPFPLPDTDANAIVAPFWDDLQPLVGTANNVFWDVAGTAPTREFVVEWRNVYHYPFGFPGFSGGTVTFEVVFHEDRDEVDFNYGPFSPGDPWLTSVNTPDVWLQVGPVEGALFDYGTALTSGTSLVWQLATGTAAPDFSMTVDAPMQTTLPGIPATFTGSLQLLSGSSSTVTISCAGAAPPSCGSNTVAATPNGTPFEIQAAASTVGSYAFQLSAQSDDSQQLSHQQAVTLSVVDYAISAPSPQTLPVLDGGAGSVAVNLSASGTFAKPVTLSCSGLPAGASCSFSPGNPVALTSGAIVPVTATVTLAPGTPLGSYPIRIVASAAGLPETRQQSVTLNVNANPDFVLTAASTNPQSISGTPAYGTFSVVGYDGYSGKVSLTCSVVPAGPACVLTPASLNVLPGSGTVEIDPSGAPVGSYQVTLTATDSTRIHTATLSYSIANPASPFSFYMGRSAVQTVMVGETTAPYDFIIAPSASYASPTKIIPWTCNPAGAVCNFTSGDTVTPNGSPVDVQMTITVPTSATYGGTTAFTAFAQDVTTGNEYLLQGGQITINVQNYALGVSTTEIVLVPGSSTQFPVSYDALYGFNLPVTIACPPDPLPPGVTCTVDKTTLNPGDVATFTFATDASAPPSFRQLNISSSASLPDGQTITRAVTLFAYIAVPTVSIDPGSVTVAAGGYANYAVTMNGAGLSSFPVTCTSPDPGITCDGPLYVSSGTFYVTVRTTNGVTPIGAHPFTVSVLAWGATVTATGTIVMQGADSLILVTPNGTGAGGGIWASGAQTIVWKYAGNPGSTVRLDLINNGTLTQTIASSVPIGSNGAGSFVWQMPASLPFSEAYTVQVTSNDNPSIKDASDDPVWMGQGIKVHFPSAGSVIINNGGYIIVEYGWSGYPQIQFDLYKGGKFVQTLVTTQVSGCFDFDIGCVWDAASSQFWNFTPGTDYSIKATPVQNPSAAVFSSGTFTISNTSITLTSPVGGEVWQPGTSHPITWTWVGDPVSPGQDLEITLGSSAYPGGYVITPTAPIGAGGSGSYVWSIPADFPPAANYRVEISVFTPTNTGVASSSPADFAIGNFHTLSVVVNGNGSVQTQDNQIYCPISHCSAIYPGGATVTLTASAVTNTVFSGWSSPCSGTGTCTVTMSGDVTVTANFTAVSQDLGVSSPSSPPPIAPGGTAQYTITLSPQGGLSGTVNLTCAGLPAESSCVFQPNNFALSQTAASTLTISTTAASAAFLRPEGDGPSWTGFRLITAGLLCVAFYAWGQWPIRRRKWLLWSAAMMLVFLMGCGGGAGTGTGGSGNPGTPAGTYTITVSAQVGSVSRSTGVTLIVQ